MPLVTQVHREELEELDGLVHRVHKVLLDSLDLLVPLEVCIIIYNQGARLIYLLLSHFCPLRHLKVTDNQDCCSGILLNPDIHVFLSQTILQVLDLLDSLGQREELEPLDGLVLKEDLEQLDHKVDLEPQVLKVVLGQQEALDIPDLLVELEVQEQQDLRD